MSIEAIVGVVTLFLTIVSSATFIGVRVGRLETKVDTLTQQVADESAARIRLLEALTDRVEKLSTQFVEHAVQDAAHFGEIKGILGQPSQVKVVNR